MVPPRPEAFGVWMSTPAIRRTARTASAMTSAFCSFAMEPGFYRAGARPLGPDRAEPRIDRFPVQGVEPRGHVVGAPVLVLEVVSVLPHVDAQQRRQLVHERAVLVGVALDRQLSLPVRDEPRPAAAELPDRGLLQLLLELVIATDGGLDRVGDASRGVATAARTHDRPADGVVGVAAGVVADRRPDVLRDVVDPPEQVFDRFPAQLGVLLDRGVGVRHIGGVVLVVVDLHRLRVDVWLERIERIRKLGNFECHDTTPLALELALDYGNQFSCWLISTPTLAL